MFELYDLEKDPNEFNNLAGNSDMKKELVLILSLLLGSLSSHAIERPPWAGFYSKRVDGALETTRFPYLKGYADRVSWNDVETEPGVYDWSKMDARIRDAAKGKYYYYFVLWSGPHAPEWIYEHGVPRVAVSGSRGWTLTVPMEKNIIAS